MKCPTCHSDNTKNFENISTKYQCENCGIIFTVVLDKNSKFYKLYEKFAPVLSVKFKRKFNNLPDDIVDEKVHEAFLDNIEQLERIDKIEGFLSTVIGRKLIDVYNKAKKFIPIKSKQSSKTKEFISLKFIPIFSNADKCNELEVVEKTSLQEIDWREREECLQACVVKAMDRYKSEYPHALCPLLVTLADNQRPLEEIAEIIFQTVPETEKLLKECHNKMRRYKDYEAYRKACGAKSLCWLLLFCVSEKWSNEKIEKTLNITPDNRRTMISRCRKMIQTYVKECQKKL